MIATPRAERGREEHPPETLTKKEGGGHAEGLLHVGYAFARPGTGGLSVGKHARLKSKDLHDGFPSMLVSISVVRMHVYT